MTNADFERQNIEWFLANNGWVRDPGGGWTNYLLKKRNLTMEKAFEVARKAIVKSEAFK